ncbi:uncharacterized protein (C-terminal fragment), partial [Ustilago hordei]
RHSSNGSAKLHYLSGRCATQYQDRHDSLYTANITLCDASGVFLQRFGPPMQYAAQAMKEEAAIGNADEPHKAHHLQQQVQDSKPAWPWQEAAENHTLEPTLDLPELLPTVHEESMPIQTLCKDPQHAHIFKWLHLSVWHDQAYQRLQLTADTLQNNGTNTAREAVSKFSEWLQCYTTKHVSLLVAGNQIKTESIHYPWVKEHVAGYDKFCHPLYLTFVPFRGFTIEDHTDMADSAISILLNFGQHAVLKLPDYNIKLGLQPLDIVLFRSNVVYHKTTQHLSDQAVVSDVAECWAITCFFHKAIEQHMEPSIQNVFHYVAKVHSDTQQGEGRQKQGKKRQKQ